MFNRTYYDFSKKLPASKFNHANPLSPPNPKPTLNLATKNKNTSPSDGDIPSDIFAPLSPYDGFDWAGDCVVDHHGRPG